MKGVDNVKLETTRFGEIEVAENEIITFKQGLYGFRDEHQFVLLSDEETDFCWLQSITNPDLAFIVIEPWAFCKDYEFDLSEEVKSELEVESEKDILVLNIVVVPENPREMTMNLKAPVIVNKGTYLAKQIILDSEEYPIKYRLFGEKESGVRNRESV